MKPKYGQKTKLSYTNTDRFILQVKSDDVYADPVGHVEEGFNRLNHEAERQLPTDKKGK